MNGVDVVILMLCGGARTAGGVWHERGWPMNGVDVVILMLCVGASLAAAVCFVLAAVEARSVCKCGRCGEEDFVEAMAARRDRITAEAIKAYAADHGLSERQGRRDRNANTERWQSFVRRWAGVPAKRIVEDRGEGAA